MNEVIQGTVALEPEILVLFAVWVLAMISLPVVRWTAGEAGVPAGVSVGVLAQTILVVTLSAIGVGLPVALGAALVVGAGGWLLEFAGSRSGVLFGRYEYTGRLQPQIARVPFVIPLAWIMMMPPAWAVASYLVPDGGTVAFAAVAAAAFVAWDLFLDPQMVEWGFWRWHDGGHYLGIPLRNFAGWFVGAFLLTLAVSALFGRPEVPAAPLFAVYAIMWILESVGQTFFWRLRASAAVGFIGMGLFVALVLFTGAAG